MGITVEEIKSSRRAGWSAEGGRTYSLQVRVGTDSPLVGPRTALLSVGVDAGAYYREPLWGTATEWDFGAFLNSIEITEEAEDGLSWVCTLDYKSLNWQATEGGSGDGASASAFIANPLNVPPSLKWSSIEEEVAVTHDRDGVPIINTAGDPFDPVLTIPVSIPIASISRTLARFDPSWILTYKNHTNASAWMGFPAGTVLCKDITADKTYDGDWGYLWTQNLEFAFKPIITAGDGTIVQPGWTTQVLNVGMRERNGLGVVKPVMIDGAPVGSPVCLTEAGRYLPDADPYYLKFELLPQVDFSGFDLPPDLFSAEAFGSPVGGS